MLPKILPGNNYDYLLQRQRKRVTSNEMKKCGNVMWLSKKEEKMKIRQFIASFRKNTDGASMIEYAILASLIAVVAIGAITTVGTKVNTTFSSVGSQLGSR